MTTELKQAGRVDSRKKGEGDSGLTDRSETSLPTQRSRDVGRHGGSVDVEDP